jgi:hypothetical protein
MNPSEHVTQKYVLRVRVGYASVNMIVNDRVFSKRTYQRRF